MFTFLNSLFQRSRWCRTSRPSLWRRWLQSALVMLLCLHQRKSRFASFNPVTNIYNYTSFSVTQQLISIFCFLKEKNKAGDLLGDTEKTSTDKKRERRHKKKVKRLKIQEKEKRQKLKEASRTGGNKKPSKAEVTENLKKLTKGGKAVILKVEHFIGLYTNQILIVSDSQCEHFYQIFSKDICYEHILSSCVLLFFSISLYRQNTSHRQVASFISTFLTCTSPFEYLFLAFVHLADSSFVYAG